MGAKEGEVTLTLSRVAHMASNAAEKQRKIEAAHHYYGRFDNVFTGPGIVEGGMIKPLPCKTPIEDLGESLLIGTPQEMIDKLAPYAELGIDRVILNPNFGLDANDTLDAIAAFAEDVMPHFARRQILRRIRGHDDVSSHRLRVFHRRGWPAAFFDPWYWRGAQHMGEIIAGLNTTLYGGDLRFAWPWRITFAGWRVWP